VKNHPSHRVTPGRHAQKFGNDYHLAAGGRQRVPWEAVPEIWEHPSSMLKMSMVGPLGGGAEGPGVPTVNAKNVGGGPPRKQCERSESTHHQ
jgi:hypothetical protein